MTLTTWQTEETSPVANSDAEQNIVPVMRAERLGKQYGLVTVLADVTLDILPGEIHAIIGENGAGKSTLMRLLSGYTEPTQGRMFVEGAPVAFAKPNEAQQAGVALVHQEILLADGLTVTENMFLGRELGRRGFAADREMRRRAAQTLADIGCAASPGALVRDLSLADKQLVQIARALLEDHKIVIFDEPTAVLTGGEVERLLDIVFELKARGIAVLYISHRLDEVQRIADKVTVLRDGKLIGTYPGRTLRQQDMARLMVGRELAALYPDKPAQSCASPLFSVRDAHVPGRVHGVSFAVAKGEILGFAGMIGAGRTEMFEAVLGLRPGSARVELDGRPIVIRSPRQAMEAGVGYLTEDRKGKGLLLQERLAPNLSLSALSRLTPGLFLRRWREAETLRDAIRQYDIRLRSLKAKAGELSGGNQQKLLLAKVLLTEPKVVVIDEPTRGIDIANKAQLYQFIRSLAAQGKGCIVLSSEMQELIGLCDRILVMRKGRIAGELRGDEITESRIALLATGDAEAFHAAEEASP
jgi:ribose transport system ATP-binding protein